MDWHHTVFVLRVPHPAAARPRALHICALCHFLPYHRSLLPQVRWERRDKDGRGRVVRRGTGGIEFFYNGTNNGTKFRPQQCQGIVCSQQTTAPQQLGHKKQDTPHISSLWPQLSHKLNSTQSTR
jgi:hypothetical protein